MQATVASALTVRFRVDFGNRCSVGVGKIELLEGIARTGSISQAAREMRMSYRRAWLLLEDMNVSFDHPVARASVGGRGGGGVVLTSFGSGLVAGYRRLEASLRPLAKACMKEVGQHIKAGAPKRTIRSASIKRKAAARAR
jgi:molybdate transport system regulatory protein